MSTSPARCPSSSERNGARGARTLDLRHAMAALSQLSYSPKTGHRIVPIAECPSRSRSAGCPLPRRNELRHVEIVARVLATSPAAEQAEIILAPRHARAGLI